MYVIHYCTMVTIQRKPRLLPTYLTKSLYLDISIIYT